MAVYSVSRSVGFVVLGWFQYGVSKVLDMAYWGFLGVGTTFDILQNILFPYSLNMASLSWILRIGSCGLLSLVSAGTDTPYLP
ncbi:hypothetical protein Tco_0796747 [Tanacetum coccineum]